MHPIVNQTESRVRAGVRIPIYIIFAFLIVALCNSMPMGGLEYLMTTLLSVGFFWVMFRFVDNRRDIRLAGIYPTKNWWLELIYGIGIAAIVMSIIFCVQYFSGTIQFLGFGWDQPGSSSWFYPFCLFLFQMACVGFYEELISRSYLVSNFKEGVTVGKIDSKKATILAVIFSSSIFGIAHGLNPNVTFFAVLNIFLAGVMLAIPYIITGRLAYSVGIHFAWNFFQGGVFGFRVSGIPVRGSLVQIQQGGEAMWTGASFGPEGGLIGTVGILLVLIFSLVLIKRSGMDVKLHPNFVNSYQENEQLAEENP